MYAYPRSHQVSEGCHFKEAMCAIPLLQWWSDRCAQGKQQGWTQGQWPKMSIEFLLYVLKTSESSAELKSLDVDSLLIEHIQVNKTSSLWGRT